MVYYLHLYNHLATRDLAKKRQEEVSLAREKFETKACFIVTKYECIQTKHTYADIFSFCF